LNKIKEENSLQEHDYKKENFYFKDQITEVPKITSKTLVEFSGCNLKIKEKEPVEEDGFYPLIRNYPNGSEDYYLKLESKKIRSKVKVLFIKKNIFCNNIFNLFKSLNCIDEKNYELIITTKNKVLNPNKVPVIFINCEPNGFLDKNKMFYFYNKTNLYKKYKYCLQTNNIKHMYRKNSFEIIEFICKLKKEKLL